MLLFQAEESIDRWCVANKLVRGEVLSLAQLWQLSRLWYGDRLSPEFRGWTTAEAEAIFRKVGLRSAFWSAS